MLHEDDVKKKIENIYAKMYEIYKKEVDPLFLKKENADKVVNIATTDKYDLLSMEFNTKDRKIQLEYIFDKNNKRIFPVANAYGGYIFPLEFVNKGYKNDDFIKGMGVHEYLHNIIKRPKSLNIKRRILFGQYACYDLDLEKTVEEKAKQHLDNKERKILEKGRRREMHLWKKILKDLVKTEGKRFKITYGIRGVPLKEMNEFLKEYKALVRVKGVEYKWANVMVDNWWNILTDDSPAGKIEAAVAERYFILKKGYLKAHK